MAVLQDWKGKGRKKKQKKKKKKGGNNQLDISQAAYAKGGPISVVRTTDTALVEAYTCH